ncbi:MAG TPA: translocation/assembly module TamB domain-containing protein, partial [Armatimonadota bacterium]
MRRIRSATSLITIVPLFVLAAASLWYASRVAHVIVRTLPGALSSLAAESINGTVQVGSIETFPAGVILRNVVVETSNGKTPLPLLRSPMIRITADIRELASGKVDPVQCIKTIDVESPEMFLDRRPGRKWNISHFLKPSKKRKAKIKNAVVNVRNGTFVLRDSARPDTQVSTNTISGINGKINLGPTFQCDLSGRGPKERLGDIRVTAHYTPSSKAYGISLDARNADVKYWTSYPLPIGLDILGGKAHIIAEMDRPVRSKPIKYSASIDVERGVVQFKPIQHAFTDIKGKIEVADGVVGIRAKGSLGKSPVSVKGYVIGFHNPRLLIDAEADRADLQQIAGYAVFARKLTAMHLPHAGKANVRVFGITKSLGVEFDVDSPSISYFNHKFSNAEVKGVYFDRRVRITSATGDIYGGRARLSGDIDVSSSPSAVVKGNYDSVDAGMIPAAKKWQLSASSDGSFDAYWTPGGLDVRFGGKVSRGRVKSYPFENASYSARYVKGGLKIDKLDALIDRGVVAAAGTVSPDGALAIQVAGADLNLASVASLFTNRPIVGRGQFSGMVRGTVQNPVFDGDLDAYRVMASGFGADRIAGKIVASRRKIDISKLTVFSYPGTVDLSGSVLLPPNLSPVVKLSIEADRIPIERYAARFHGFPALGVASGRFDVTGMISNPRADGVLKVDRGTIYGMPVESAECTIVYQNKRLAIDKLTASSGNAVLNASGRMGDNGEIWGEFAATGLPLYRLNRFTRPYVSLAGNGDFTGKVSGTTSHPVLDVGMNCLDLAVNGQRFGKLEGKVLWEKNSQITSTINLSDGKSEYSIRRMKYDQATRIAEVDASVHEGDGGKLVQILSTSQYVRGRAGAEQLLSSLLNTSDETVSGVLNADISGRLHLDHGSLDPDLKFSMGFSDIKYGDDTLKSLDIVGVWKGEVFSINKLEASEGDMNVSGDGSLGPKDGMRLNVDAHNFSLDALRPWVKLPDNFSGRADVTIVAKGSLSAPDADISIEFVDPVIAGIKVDRLRTRLSTVGSASDSGGPGVRINEFRMALGDYGLSAAGFIPVDWKTLAVPKDRSIFVESNLDSGSLQVLSAFTHVKLDTAAGGTFGGSVRVSGSGSAPELQGSLKWSKGVIRLPMVDGTLENVRALVSLDGNKLAIEDLSGVSSEGGSFNAKGQILLAVNNPSVDISVHTANLQLSGRNFSGKYGEEVKSRINADLRITGDPRSPLVKGNVSIPDGYLSLLGKPYVASAGTGRSINPKFGLEVLLGKNVEFRSSRLRAPLYGKLTIGG